MENVKITPSNPLSAEVGEQFKVTLYYLWFLLIRAGSIISLLICQLVRHENFIGVFCFLAII